MKKNTCFHRLKRLFRGSPTEWKNLPKRTIQPGQADLHLPNNRITTSKYTILTFLPLNLVEQFTKMANIYFLIVGILQMIPAITVSDGMPTEYTALVVIVIATAIKDMLEDLQRHKADKKENHSLISGRLAEEIRVGEIIRIEPNQQIPADVLLINDECFVETSQLDGETTLKPKQPVAESIQFIEAQGPNPFLYQFSGSINGQKPLNEHNLLLRGSVLKSLDPIEGIVIYTGHQTKIMLNTHNPRGKVSKMQQLMNKLILYLFIGQWLLCFFCASYFIIALNIKENQLSYLYLVEPNQLHQFAHFCQSVGNWFLLFVNFVPISLMLTLEMIRLFQAYFIKKDIGYDTKVQSSNLNDDLGQIHQIFSDKTGTLTANQMTLRKVCFKKNNINLTMDNIEVLFKEENLIYLLQFVVCNDIRIKNGNILSSSSDEIAIINFFIKQGIELQELENNCFSLKFRDKEIIIKKLYLIPFDSCRKRLSMLLEFNNEQYIFTKGADVIIVERCHFNENSEELYKIGREYAEQGLRVLAFGFRKLESSEFVEWLDQYEKMLIKQDEKMLEVLQNQIERNLTLSCVTGVEDIIAESVQESIMELQQAQIQIWMITGDAHPTAQGVARKIGLMNKRCKVLVVKNQSIDDLEKQITDSSSNINNFYEVALIILGQALIDYNQEDKYKLIKVAKLCQSVLFCRVSPKQKREIVELFRKCFPQLCTLAIGDGANDVNMITEANVGVGVCGVEGLQAARAADYAIPLFRDLQRLLLYHGRECYRRNTQVVTYNFYKNVLYLFPQFWFGLYSQFSAQSIYDFYVFQCYNFMFTSLPIIIYGVFDIKYQASLPKQYCIGQKDGYLNFKIFVLSLLEGVLQSAIIFFFTFYFFNQCARNGLDYGFVLIGQVIFLICIIVANTKIIMLSHEIHLLQIIIQILSYISYIATILIFNSVTDYSLYGVVQEILSQGTFYLTVIFTSFLAMCQVLYYKKFKQYKNYEKVEELQGVINTSLLSL